MPLRSSGRAPSSVQPPRRASLRLVLTVWWRATELDRRLAGGEAASTSDALELRARRLTTLRHRKRLADGLASVLRTTENGRRHGFTAAVQPRSRELADAAPLITFIGRRLRMPKPVTAQSVALIRLLLIDGNSPLYRSTEPGTLASQLRSAAATLNAPIVAN